MALLEANSASDALHPPIPHWHQGNTGENTGVRFPTPPTLDHVVAFLEAGIRHEIGLASLLAGNDYYAIREIMWGP